MPLKWQSSPRRKLHHGVIQFIPLARQSRRSNSSRPHHCHLRFPRVPLRVCRELACRHGVPRPLAPTGTRTGGIRRGARSPRGPWGGKAPGVILVGFGSAPRRDAAPRGDALCIVVLCGMGIGAGCQSGRLTSPGAAHARNNCPKEYGIQLKISLQGYLANALRRFPQSLLAVHL